MSESELAAAIWPYENGSSTIGVKKSTVCTSARWRSNRYTPASSNVFELTSTFRFNEMGSCGKTCRRACWLNFDAHPAQDESDVSFRICSRDMWFTSFPIAAAVAVALRATRAFRTAKRLQGLIQIRGEDRNRTYLATCVATTVLKTAKATRHPSLSGLQKIPNAQPRKRRNGAGCSTSNAECFVREARFGVRRLDTVFEGPTTSHGFRTYQR